MDNLLCNQNLRNTTVLAGSVPLLRKRKPMQERKRNDTFERKNMIKWIRNTMSLEKISYAFTDIVVGKPVYYWRDRDGVIWMKHSKWGLFRCRSGMVDSPEEKS